MIKFNRLKLNNFVLYDNLEFNIPTDEPTLVLGVNMDSNISESNGSGKSLLFESIIWCLYGKTERGRIKGENTSVVLEFHTDIGHIKVERYSNYDRWGNKVRLYINDELQDYHTIKETNEAIRNIVGVPYEHFISSVVLVQDFPKVTEMKPSQFNEYFSQFIDFNYDSLIERLKAELKRINSNIAAIKERVSELNMNKSYLEGKISIYKEKLGNIQLKLNEVRSRIPELEKQLISIKGELENMKEHVDTYNKLIFKRDRLRRDIEILSSGKCPLCGSVVSKDHLESYKSSLLKLESVISKYENIKSRYEELLLKERELSSEIRSLKYLADELERQKKYTREVDMWRRELNTIKSELSSMEEELSKLEDREAKCKELSRLLQPGGDIRTRVTNYYLNVYYQIVRDIANTIGDEFLSSISDISDINYRKLSGGEKSRVNIILHIALADFISRFNRTNFNLMVFDESFDYLDFKSMVNIIEFIKSYFSYKSIYIISHNSELKKYFNKYIIVSRRNGRSNISVEYQY